MASGGPARQPGPQDLADGGVGDAQHLASGGDHFQRRQRPVLGGFDDRDVVHGVVDERSPRPGALTGRVAQGGHPLWRCRRQTLNAKMATDGSR